MGAAGKTGWFYILDRLTGEPLIPCPDTAVPTLSNVVAPDGKTEQVWPTQPFCQSDIFMPQGGRFNSAGDYISLRAGLSCARRVREALRCCSAIPPVRAASIS